MNQWRCFCYMLIWCKLCNDSIFGEKNMLNNKYISRTIMDNWITVCYNMIQYHVMPLPRHFWKSSVPVMLHPLCVDIRGFFFHGSLRQAVVARNTRVPRDFRTPTKPMPSKSVPSAPLQASCCTSRLQKSSEPGTVREKCRPAKSKSHRKKKIFIIVLRCFEFILCSPSICWLSLSWASSLGRMKSLVACSEFHPVNRDESHCDDGTQCCQATMGRETNPSISISLWVDSETSSLVQDRNVETTNPGGWFVSEWFQLLQRFWGIIPK